MAIHSSSSSTSARARRAVAQDVASRVKRIDASRHYAAQIIEILVEMTRADDARERRRRARVRARAHIIFRARYRRVVGGRRASREGGTIGMGDARARVGGRVNALVTIQTDGDETAAATRRDAQRELDREVTRLREHAEAMATVLMRDDLEASTRERAETAVRECEADIAV